MWIPSLDCILQMWSYHLISPKYNTLNFSKLSLILHWLVHSVTATRSFCILLTLLNITAVSSRWLMYTTKKVVQGQSLVGHRSAHPINPTYFHLQQPFVYGCLKSLRTNLRSHHVAPGPIACSQLGD